MAVGSLLREGTARLVETALPGGGVGYHRGGQPFVEPTALALLAIAPVTPSKPTSLESQARKSLDTLASWQNPQGFFGAMPEDPDPSWTTAPALLALLAHGEQERAMTAARWLTEWKLPKEPPSESYRQEIEQVLKIDVGIPGWPWQAGELFVTVEPTALACIALRACGGPGTAERISEGLRYFNDRACAAGGWNYGTPHFLDSALAPIARPTAKALLALLICGEPPESPLVTGAREALSGLLEENPSRKANAWGALAYAAAGDRPRAQHHAQLAVDSGDGRGPWWGGPDCTALALLALRAAEGEAPRCLTAPKA